jgi:hypothetical protein
MKEETTNTIHDVCEKDGKLAACAAGKFARTKVCWGDSELTTYAFIAFSSPATKLADINFLLEILGFSDLITDPTAMPATITGIMIGIWGIEVAPCSRQGCN